MHPPEVPCLVYEEASMRMRYEALTSFLESRYPNNRILYALKACYVPPVVKTIVQLGCGVEVMSLHERLLLEQLTLEGHVNSPEVVWNGPSLDTKSLQFAVEKGEHINVDSPHIFSGIERISEQQQASACVSLRINRSGRGRLGMMPADAEKLLQKSSKLVTIEGFHIHYGPATEIGNVWLDERLLFFDLVHGWEKTFGINIKRINLGGGLPHPDKLAETVEPLIERLNYLQSDPILFFEPGAFLVEQAGTAFAHVVAVKSIGDTTWASLDLGGNILVPLQRTHLEVDSAGLDKSDGVTRFGGPICYEADIIGSTTGYMVQPGQIIKINRAGAYTASMASCFGSPPPPIFWRKANGDYKKVKRTTESTKLFLGYHGFDLMEEESERE